MRYTISRHDSADGIHYDLFLEEADSLRTFRLTLPPEAGGRILEEIDPHRKLYLDYEGPISGDRGTVAIHSTGVYRHENGMLVLEGGRSAGRYHALFSPSFR